MAAAAAAAGGAALAPDAPAVVPPSCAAPAGAFDGDNSNGTPLPVAGGGGADAGAGAAAAAPTKGGSRGRAPRGAAVPSPSPSPPAAAPTTTVAFDAVRPSGYVLPGVLEQVDGSPSRHAIVMCHGLLSTRDHNFAPALSTALARATGHAVLRFDFRFDAAPDLEPDFRYRFSGFADDVDDLGVVLRALTAAGWRPWLLVGHSRGANDVLTWGGSPAAVAASGVPAFAIAALSARFDMPAMFTRLFPPETVATVDAGGVAAWESKRGALTVTPDDVEVVRRHMDMGAAVAAIPPDVPVLLVHGAEDAVIPVADAAAFQAARPSMEVVVIPGAKHAFAGKVPSRTLLDTVVQFATRAAAALHLPTVPPA